MYVYFLFTTSFLMQSVVSGQVLRHTVSAEQTLTGITLAVTLPQAANSPHKLLFVGLAHCIKCFLYQLRCYASLLFYISLSNNQSLTGIDHPLNGVVALRLPRGTIARDEIEAHYHLHKFRLFELPLPSRPCLLRGLISGFPESAIAFSLQLIHCYSLWQYDC